ncbi:MAG TPA: DnaJ domain-containing protein [Bryobacteraceae bacterium]|nr:DnaJ domain-containing protein [Bryobacteraceae bacterium]
MKARIVDISEQGIGLELSGPLDRDEVVQIASAAQTPAGHSLLSRMARVRWCSRYQGHQYRAGLCFDAIASASGNMQHDSEAEEDHYEALQLSSNADAETIQRVFRIMAQRYHPDNLQTGNVDLFRKVKESYDVLSDPCKRAAYDVRRNAYRTDRFKIFNGWQSSTGIEAEKRKRQGILAVLYAQRANNAQQPSITMHEMEDLLACPKEHLEFSLWFLRECKYIARTDNNRFSITCEGVMAAEREPAVIPIARHKRLAPPA